MEREHEDSNRNKLLWIIISLIPITAAAILTISIWVYDLNLAKMLDKTIHSFY